MTSATINTTAALSDFLRSTQHPMRVLANASWQHAGRPVTHNAQPLDVRGITGIVEYVPGDLTMTVRAGTSHHEIDAATVREGQWMGLDPAGAAAGTIGATVATASFGPLAHAHGTVRDVVLGVEVVTGDGTIVRSGGKVVKNVAGFDLVRLQTGAWGTLGVLTEISVRLRARPEVDETVAIALEPRKPLMAHLLALRSLALGALALELISPSLAKQLGLPEQTHLLFRLGGNSARVAAQRSSLATLGTPVSCSQEVWSTLAAIDGTANAVARVSHLPSQLADTWAHVHSELADAGLPSLTRATISRGLLRIVIPETSGNGVAPFGITRTIAPPGGHVVWEVLPPTLWASVPSMVADSLSYGLQLAFDPGQRCNPGILGASFVP